MKLRALFVIVIAVLGACNDIGSGSNTITTRADGGAAVACTDDFDPMCWTGPWGDFEPPDVDTPDAGVGDAPVADGHLSDAGISDAHVFDAHVVDATTDTDASPDAGCTGQAEPACPQPPGGYLARNPGIVGGGQCRGACGPACPATCRAGTPTTTCLEWQTNDCQWHAKVCTYPVLECGSAQGCRDHDDCYDACAMLPWYRRSVCRRECDASCIRRHGITTCNSWRKGNGPFDSWLQYTGAPTSSTSNTTCF